LLLSEPLGGRAFLLLNQVFFFAVVCAKLLIKLFIFYKKQNDFFDHVAKEKLYGTEMNCAISNIKFFPEIITMKHIGCGCAVV
jgi:hypothetical protein